LTSSRKQDGDKKFEFKEVELKWNFIKNSGNWCKCGLFFSLLITHNNDLTHNIILYTQSNWIY